MELTTRATLAETIAAGDRLLAEVRAASVAHVAADGGPERANAVRAFLEGLDVAGRRRARGCGGAR